MIRFVNVRIPLTFAICLSLGIAIGVIFAYYNIEIFYSLTAIPVCFFIVILLAILKKGNMATVVTLLCCALLLVGAFYSSYSIEKFSSSDIDSGCEYTLSGTVYDKKTTDSSEYIIIEDIKINNKACDGRCIVYLSSSYGEFCDIGYTVKFTTSVYQNNYPFPYGELNSNIQDNVKYYCSVYEGMTSTYHYSFFYSVRSALRDTIYKNVDSDTAPVIFAMLTGSTTDMDSETLTTFRYGGMAHIFAVSGLHIGIVYLLLSFVLKKLRLNKYLFTILTCGGIFFYAGVCAFTISSVRAMIMCAISSITRLIYCKYDSLNSLSFSVLVILFLNPLNLFDVGFQLSVCAVGGIILLNNKLSRLFYKIPKKISSPITISLSAQAGTLPVMLVHFGYLSGAGLLLNIVIIPILSAIFVALFISTILCTIITPIAVYVMPVVALPLQLLLSLLIGAGFEKALLSGFGAGLFIVLYYIAILLLSDKLNIHIIKRTMCIVLSLVLLVSYSLVRTYAPINGYEVIISANYSGGGVVIKNGSDSVLILTGGETPSSFLKLLNNNYISKLSAIILLGGEDELESFTIGDTNCSTVYVSDKNYTSDITKNFTYNYENKFNLAGIEFEFTDEYSLLATIDGVKLGICAGEIPYYYCDILVSATQNEYCHNLETVYFNIRCKLYNVYDYGTIKYYIQGGNFKMLSLLPERIYL
jgi:ComEC/Rec2-related protein